MEFLASLVLAIHLLWVYCGSSSEHSGLGGRPLVTAFHILSLVWDIAVQLSPLPCPLTIAEQFFEQKAGAEAYSGTFLARLLDRLVYPNLPEGLRVGIGVVVCAINIGFVRSPLLESRSLTG